MGNELDIEEVARRAMQRLDTACTPQYGTAGNPEVLKQVSEALGAYVKARDELREAEKVRERTVKKEKEKKKKKTKTEASGLLDVIECEIEARDRYTAAEAHLRRCVNDAEAALEKEEKEVTVSGLILTAGSGIAPRKPVEKELGDGVKVLKLVQDQVVKAFIETAAGLGDDPTFQQRAKFWNAVWELHEVGKVPEEQMAFLVRAQLESIPEGKKSAAIGAIVAMLRNRNDDVCWRDALFQSRLLKIDRAMATAETNRAKRAKGMSMAQYLDSIKLAVVIRTWVDKHPVSSVISEVCAKEKLGVAYLQVTQTFVFRLEAEGGDPRSPLKGAIATANSDHFRSIEPLDQARVASHVPGARAGKMESLYATETVRS